MNTRPWIFQIRAWRKIFWEIFGMVAQCRRTRGPHLWHATASGYVKVQTPYDTCEGVCAVKRGGLGCHAKTMPSHTWFMGYMKFCCTHIQHTNRHRPNHLFLLSSGVHITGVMLLFQTHIHFPSCNLSPFSQRTCLNSLWVHFEFTTQNGHEFWQHS